LLEGYVWDIAEGPALAMKAIEIGKRNGAAIALSLSDSFCVERHKASFVEIAEQYADLVLGDDDEVNMLLGTDSTQESLAAIDGRSNLFAITCGAQGSVIYSNGKVIKQAADKIEKVIDTTGAGDAYTAGFLYGWANGWDLQDAARLGTHVASNVIQQVGARFEAGLLDSFTR
jgi:sugar/nucleoside kinase (ribokinase family)